MPMPEYRRFARRVLAALAILSATQSLSADDGAASIAAGGIVMVREPRITMQKEVLRISADKVQVDYEFRNDTSADITTQVAFPVPAYSVETLDLEDPSLKQLTFEDFRLSVEGLPVHYRVETKAILKGRNVSAVLAKYKVDVETLGHVVGSRGLGSDIERLSNPQRIELLKAGLITKGPYSFDPTWKVQKKYYWLQTFPAHSVIHISHQYTPVLGNSNTIGDPADYNSKNEKDAEFAALCPTPALIDTLKRMGTTDRGVASMSYVDFILTTANTWKTPIKDFTLIVERPRPTRSYPKQDFVSFCWDGPVTKTDADHFSAHLTNFIPRKELKVGLITPY